MDFRPNYLLWVNDTGCEGSSPHSMIQEYYCKLSRNIIYNVCNTISLIIRPKSRKL